MFTKHCIMHQSCTIDIAASPVALKWTL